MFFFSVFYVFVCPLSLYLSFTIHHRYNSSIRVSANPLNFGENGKVAKRVKSWSPSLKRHSGCKVKPQQTDSDTKPTPPLPPPQAGSQGGSGKSLQSRAKPVGCVEVKHAQFLDICSQCLAHAKGGSCGKCIKLGFNCSCVC
jgi:hypothetical protein